MGKNQQKNHGDVVKIFQCFSNGLFGVDGFSDNCLKMLVKLRKMTRGLSLPKQRMQQCGLPKEFGRNFFLHMVLFMQVEQRVHCLIRPLLSICQ